MLLLMFYIFKNIIRIKLIFRYLTIPQCLLDVRFRRKSCFKLPIYHCQGKQQIQILTQMLFSHLLLTNSLTFLWPVSFSPLIDSSFNPMQHIEKCPALLPHGGNFCTLFSHMQCTCSEHQQILSPSMKSSMGS